MIQYHTHIKKVVKSWILLPYGAIIIGMKNAPKSLHNAKLANKTVLVRVDYNVPVIDGTIIDDLKIKATIPTIQHLLKNNCKVILLSHIGDPKGKQQDNLSLMDVRFALGRILEKQIKFANIAACENSIKFMDFGEVLILENLKFSPLETSKKETDRDEYVKALVKLADLFVFESYGMDSNVASITAIAGKLPTYMGLHLEEEIEVVETLVKKSKEPIVAVIGNEEIHKNIALLEALSLGKNKILLGGEMAMYFLSASEVKTGTFEPDAKVLAKINKFLKNSKKSGCEFIMPVDHICENHKGELVEVTTQQINKDLTALDIGPKTLISYREIIEAANTVIWQGTLGLFTKEQFNKGTEAIGEYIALSTSKECFKVSFGGQVSHAMNILKIKPKRFNFISLDSVLFVDFMQNKESDILTLLSKKRA